MQEHDSGYNIGRDQLRFEGCLFFFKQVHPATHNPSVCRGRRLCPAMIFLMRTTCILTTVPD